MGLGWTYPWSLWAYPSLSPGPRSSRVLASHPENSSIFDLFSQPGKLPKAIFGQVGLRPVPITAFPTATF
ncbi:hypothetical protein U1Q18_021342 [Sarracenia purpurea var. burkii]